MRKVTYVNAKGVSIELSNTAPFLLQKIETTNNVTIYNSKGVNQDGRTYLGNTLNERDITLTVMLLAKSKDELTAYRDEINAIFNPKYGEGYLIYKDNVKERKVKCLINKMPFFKITDTSYDDCLISMTASNPFWTDIDESKEEIALWVGDFSFELELTEDGIEMGHREPSLIVNVFNGGDVECGMRVEFKALATLTNPSILNVNTQEFIKINKEMIAGETITVSTYFGNKKVRSDLNGVTTNAFNYIDVGSTFLQLDVGDNLFRYNSDTNLDNLEVTIYYMPQYLGV
ncbi:phage tail family protein [Desulfosporosinus meridiei]|uniref:Phage tail protein n=1 Tax=Desulfosporosinus meridiei (strain ATCC BAA-275 / DSM 13257 / KCTC 12902 / NCIMB 13706 / S10) TaxID=768704 RepID=J7IX04_DESMD|nr:phage tail family protein [Desulfosporosinus meridiei]AFQ46260.1 Phage tail protein [Desulfosporosinus meridiei DSM 13257]